jgi:hypothetical protein
MCPEASLAQTAQSKHTAWGDSEKIMTMFSIWNVQQLTVEHMNWY